MKISIIVAFVCGTLVELAGPAVAENAAPERVIIVQRAIASPAPIVPVPVPVVSEKPSWAGAITGGGRGGGLGGAIGGYYINGTTRSDNRPLPGGTWPYR